jgi:hypothetical protein
MKNKIWVIEMWNEGKNRWENTVGIGWDKYCANAEKRKWKKSNPDSYFRIRKYIPQGEG